LTGPVTLAVVNTNDDEATRFLRRLANGDASASEQLLPIVYDELRRRAEQAMGKVGGQTLQPTALVHEAWMKVSGSDADGFESRGHFVAVAAKAMRQILIDRARSRGSRQRREDRITLCGVENNAEDALDVLDLGEALTELEKIHPRPAQIAELRFFGGLEVAEVARILGVSERTVYAEWRIARAWLRRAMTSDDAK